VLDPCRLVSGTVVYVAREPDGDLHVEVWLNARERSMLLPGNRSRQFGNLMVELMPRDRGHLPKPRAGSRVRMLGAYVEDLPHGWAELHPVFALSIGAGRWHRSGPQFDAPD
jgi:hypothetical protein